MTDGRNPTKRVLTTDSVDLAVHDLGGSGPPVVFSHATGLHGLVWQPLCAQLSGSFRCISFDARGHGGSSQPPGLDFDWAGFGLDAIAISTALDLEGPVGVGHSAGATALLLAEQAQPGTFQGLYCFEPVVIPSDPPLGRDPDNWLAASARRRREVYPSRAEALSSYSSKPPFVTWAPAALRAYVQYGFSDEPDGTVRLKCRRDDEAAVYEMATANDVFPHLARVQCPVLLACGAETAAVGPAEIDELARHLPHAHVEVLPGLGHFGPLENPTQVGLSIRRFLAQHIR